MSRLSRKGQITIPRLIRNVLKIAPGDIIAYEIERGAVMIRKAIPLDLRWAESVEVSLKEWDDDGDYDL